MELRRVLICAAFLVVAAILDTTEARHSMERRAADDDINFGFMADGTSDSDTQNDAEGGEDVEEETVLAQIITQPTNYNTTVGSNIKLQCVVQPMIGVVVQWLKGKQQLFLGHSPMMPDSLKSKYAAPNDTNDLIVKDTNFNDSGEYECKIQQVPPTSIKHKLSVREAPRILRFTSEGTLVEGSDMLLTCNATGVPPPEIMWSRVGPDGNYRLGEKDGVFTANSVFMRNIQKEHSGKYYCYAFNIVGHNQAELSVNVQGKPRVHVHRTVINSAVNVSDILECSVHDEKMPSIKWLKDGVEVSPSATVTIETVGAHSNLTVTPAGDGDFGLYTCEAANAFGTHKKSIQLVQWPVVESFEADGPKLSWLVHSYQPLEAMELQLRGVNEEGDGLVISVPVPETKERSYKIDYLLNETQVKPGKYVGFLKVKNSKGWNEGEESIVLEIVQEPQAIQHASVFGGNSGEIVRPASTVFLSTTLMYLLMRML